METTEVLKLWKSYDSKLEKALKLNRTVAEDVTRLKMKSLLTAMNPIKIFTLIVGCIWVLIGGTVVTNLFVYAYPKVSHFFLFSVTIQVLLTAIAIGIYVYQLVMIHEVNVDESIMDTQKRIGRLKSSTMLVARVLFLQMPVWTTFYLSGEMFLQGNVAYILVNGLVTLTFTYFSVWLFFNIRYENRDKKWFKMIFDGPEWSPVLKSMELLKQMSEYKDQNTGTNTR